MDQRAKIYSPEIFDMALPSRFEQLQRFKTSYPDIEIVDTVNEAIEDLFKITHPYVEPKTPEYKATFDLFATRYRGSKQLEELGVWVYFPWRHCLVHLPRQSDYHILRTARNKFLVTPEEQELFSASRIGVAGLSVGSSVIQALVLSAGGKELRIADMDTLAITNLNRLYASVCDVGRKKWEIAARRIYEMNPFQELGIFPEGINSENVDDFLGRGASALNVLVEEMDDIKTKIDLRFAARERGIPVIMASDNGDTAVVDVERYDLDDQYPPFHGAVDESILRVVPVKPTSAEKVRLASRIVGKEITVRMQQSLTLVGAQIPSWPQLGNAAMLSGMAASYVARRIIIGAPMPSGRYLINTDELLDVTYNSLEATAVRTESWLDFEDAIGLIFGKES